ncbi:hypothetical protein H0S68_11480 [Serratia sp. AXJ-M]|uniref:hypothetical protein n=1 Tax=Serratia sp. AXJ-M TaxID=2754727 RepID=UPI0039798F5B
MATGNLALPVIILQQHYGAIARNTAVTAIRQPAGFTFVHLFHPAGPGNRCYYYLAQ